MTANLTPDQLQSVAYQKLHPDDNIGYKMIVSATVCATAATIAVAVRIWARRYAKVGLGPDDYLIMFVYIIYAISASLTTRYGMGKHLIYVTNANTMGAIILLGECAYNIAVATVKISVLFFYRRLFPQKWFRITLWTLGALIAGCSLARFLADLLQCTPIQKRWTSMPGTCINYSGVILFGTVFTIVTDIIIVALPIPLLWGLKVERKRRFQLIFAFCIGGLACISSIVRAIYTKNASQFDTSWYYVPLIVTTTVEMGTFMVSACIPAYAAFFTQRSAAASRTQSSRQNQSEQATKYSVNVAMSNFGPRREKWSVLNADGSQDEDKQVMVTTDIQTKYEPHSDDLDELQTNSTL